MVKDLHPATFAVLGFILGLVVFSIFLKPQVETRVTETIRTETDTVYVTKTETIVKTQFKYIYERDTVIEDYKPKIRGFKELYPFTYGNVSISGEVLGELRYMNVNTDFKIPTITNTITKEKTTTNTIIQRGIFLGGGFSDQMAYSVGVAYLGNGFMANLDYTPNMDMIQANIKINPFKVKNK